MTCLSIVNGRMAIRANGKTYEGKGDAEYEPRDIERKAEPSSTGRPMVSVAANLPKFKIAYANFPDADPLELFDLGCDIDLSVDDVDRGFTHYFFGCAVVGTPSVTQGEVRNMDINARKYQRVANTA